MGYFPTQLEAPAQPATRLRNFTSAITPTTLANALIGFIFAASGPVAVILAVGTQGGLDEKVLASWIFGSFFINGILTIAACWLYRTPMVFFWTIPGTVLVGPALSHLRFEEVVGAFYATGLLMLLLGFSGWIRRAMAAIPMQIVMGMVAGVFLQFGTGWVQSVIADAWLAGTMTAVFLLLIALPRIGRYLPPLITALVAGLLIILFDQRIAVETAATSNWLSLPSVVTPEFSWQAMFELVVPLTITVLVVQNGQGVAVLHNAGHKAPVNFITAACGLWSMLAAIVGTVSTCLTGPTNALISSSGARTSHFAAGIVVGMLALLFGLFAPAFTKWMLACPPAFIATLAGLAMLKVLQAAFNTAFGGKFQLSALITFLVTVSGISLFNIGAPFWGLVCGFAISWFIEKSDYV
ncbi:benzoate transporter [Chromatiales bacterium (ex Bugula neritina AB1)]|nr:benzoate transporter [Chromatiales bacterium (ex Bugula neritina AB1)]